MKTRRNPVARSNRITTPQTTQTLEIPSAFVLNSENLQQKNFSKEINNPLQTYARGNIYKRSYKISEALSHLRNEYVHQLFKIVDKKVITSLNTK